MHKQLKIICLVILTVITVYTILNFSVPNISKLNLQNCGSFFTEITSDKEIKFKLKISDIYRLDISCDYITNDLNWKISEKYKNTKKCSLSTLDKNTDQHLLDSFLVSSNTVQNYTPILELKQIHPKSLENINIKPGGFWTPDLKENSICKQNDLDFIVFVVPYLKRPENLQIFLNNLHLYLTTLKFKFSYGIVVAEQANQDKKFNKGQLINAAVDYVLGTHTNIDCIVLHDVDIVPLVNDSSVDYRCRQMPLHLTRNVVILQDNWNRVYNQFLTGGILSLRPKHFVDANGFSNRYAGWGGEDDDWTLRMFNADLCVLRPKMNENNRQAPFAMLQHRKSEENRDRHKTLARSLINQPLEGLNTIRKNTKIQNVHLSPLFTHLLIEIDAS